MSIMVWNINIAGLKSVYSEFSVGYFGNTTIINAI